MKKLVLAAAVLLGGIAASQAGVSINIGFGNPFPFPRPVVISRPAPVYAPVVISRPVPVCAPVVVAPPVCHDRYVQPVVMPRYGSQHPRYGYSGHSGSHRDWDRHDRGNDRRDDHRGDHRNDDRGGWGGHRR